METTQQKPTIMISATKVKKKMRKKYEVNIIDEYAFFSFKSLEDIEQMSEHENNVISATDTNKTNKLIKQDQASLKPSANNKNKTEKARKQKNNSAQITVCSTNNTQTTIQSSATINNSTTKTDAQYHHSKKKHCASSISQGSSNGSSKLESTKCNGAIKQSDDKLLVAEALEAKELAERRLLVLQEKLFAEQSKNRTLSENLRETQLATEAAIRKKSGDISYRHLTCPPQTNPHPQPPLPPPSYMITDTITRQTNIIPPMSAIGSQSYAMSTKHNFEHSLQQYSQFEPVPQHYPPHPPPSLMYYHNPHETARNFIESRFHPTPHTLNTGTLTAHPPMPMTISALPPPPQVHSRLVTYNSPSLNHSSLNNQSLNSSNLNSAAPLNSPSLNQPSSMNPSSLNQSMNPQSFNPPINHQTINQSTLSHPSSTTPLWLFESQRALSRAYTNLYHPHSAASFPNPYASAHTEIDLNYSFRPNPSQIHQVRQMYHHH